MAHLEQQLRHWLTMLKIPVAAKYLEQQLLSHPDYPSLLSVTDTLDRLGIENEAVLIDKDALAEVPVPFLAHIPSNGGSLVLVKDLKTHLKAHPGFWEAWNGIVVVAEKPAQLSNSEHNKILLEERKQKWLVLTVILACLAFSLAALGNHFSLSLLLLLCTMIAGMFTAVLILLHALGQPSPLLEQLCHAGKNTSCDAVLTSRQETWNPGDAGMIYFSFSWLFFVFSGLSGNMGGFVQIAGMLSLLSIPFTLFSLYYQARIIKKWCVLCLMTVSLLWIQALITVPAIALAADDSMQVLPAAFLFLLTAGAWLLLIKPLLFKNETLREKIWPLLRFKNNAEHFMAVLETQRRVDTCPFQDDLQLGNPEAPVQIVVACGLYCQPCAKAHAVLHELLDQKGLNLGVTVRFLISTKNPEDRQLKGVRHILQYIRQKPALNRNALVRSILFDWYTFMDADRFIAKYLIIEQHDVSGMLQDHETWCSRAQITVTPSLFINGYPLPASYTVFDLPSLIDGICSYMHSKQPASIV